MATTESRPAPLHILNTVRTGVLLAADESPASLAAARGLNAGGYRVHVAVTRGDTYVARSRMVASVDRPEPTERDAVAFVEQLAEIARARDVALVLPATEASLRAVTGREALFPSDVTVGTSPQAALDAATDKLAFQALAADAGLETIPTVELDGADVDELAGELSFPAVAKPRRTVAESDGGGLESIDATRVDTLDALRRLVDANPGRECSCSGTSTAASPRSAASRGRAGSSAPRIRSRRGSGRSSAGSPRTASPCHRTVSAREASRGSCR